MDKKENLDKLHQRIARYLQQVEAGETSS